MSKCVTHSYFNDCPEVPRHLSSKISQEQWDWINQTSEYLYSVQRNGFHMMEVWQIRGYWLITYFLNPNQENLDFMIQRMYEFGMLEQGKNLQYLEFVQDLKSRVKSC